MAETTVKKLGTLTIDFYGNGRVDVTGPIADPILAMQIMSSGLAAIAKKHVDMRKTSEKIINVLPKDEKNVPDEAA